MSAPLVLIIIGQVFALTGSIVSQAITLNYMSEMLKNISDGAWLLEQARRYGLMFDKILISYADKIYGYFSKILNGTILTPSIVNDLMNRIYIIIGIVIFFRIAMIAVKYMINPEMFLDDKVGAQTLVKRVIIGAALIIFIPTIFHIATDLQASIVSDHVIEKIILPEDIYTDIMQESNPGEKLAMMVFRGFFGWNENVSDKSNSNLYNSYEKVLTYNSISSFNEEDINEKQGDEFYISYVPIISTLAIGYLLFMLIQFSLEVALRSFKLVLMQIISPFVITGYMLDPSKEETMKKWVNVSISNYLLIFMRVFTLWFATLICYYFTNGISTNSGEISLLNDPDQLLKALIILALFAFLKSLPKVVSEILGYDFQENEAISGIMNQGVGVVKGLAMGKVGLDFAKKQLDVSKVAGAVSMIGGVAGGITGIVGGAKMYKSAVTPEMEVTASNMISNNISSINSSGSGYMGSLTSNMGSAISGAYGSSVLSPFSNSSSILANSYHSASGLDSREMRSKEGKNDDKKAQSGERQNDNSSNNSTISATQNNQNNNTFDQNTFAEILQKNGFSIDGGTVNLNAQTSNNTAMQQSQTVSPVLNTMATEIQTRLENDNIYANVNDIVGRLSTQITQIDNNGNVSVSDLTKAMNNVTNSFKVANPTQPQPVNNHTSSLNNNDTIDTI